MKESLLQFIWQFQKYSTSNLKTHDGEDLIIFNPGQLNHNAGPDFQNAHIKIGNTEWYGHIEIHNRANDWFAHGHHQDNAYDNVILHVVYSACNNHLNLPTLELKNRIPHILLDRYRQLMSNQQFIPCENMIQRIEPFTWIMWKDRLLAERLQEKTRRIQESLQNNTHDWQQLFFEQLAYNFGLKSNENTFSNLAQRIPLRIIQKHKHNLFQIEALLFGCSGLLTKPIDEYTTTLINEYTFLQKKYNLNQLPKVSWNFGRIRPANFPTIRIAQLATLLHQSSALFSKVMESISIHDIYKLMDVNVSEYWKTHYTFGSKGRESEKRIGRSKIENIAINTIVPFQFLFAQRKSKDDLAEKAIQLLRDIRPEKNSIINKWQNLRVSVKNAYDSQALFYLYKGYCSPKQCLKCKIGHNLLN